MVFGDFTVREEFVKLSQLHERSRGEDIMNVFLKFVKECNLPLSKLVAITTDGAPSITDRNNGFLALCAKDESFPNVLSYHCITAKVLKFDHVMNVVTRVVNYIRSSSTRKVHNISSMISVVNAFQKKLQLWIAHLNRNSFSHFPHMKSVVETLNGCEYDLPSFAQHLEALVTEFGNRFSQFSTLEPVTMFISNVSELGGEVCEIFGEYNLEELEMEILNFQGDISLKSSFASCSNFWTLVDRNKYPMIHSIALKIYSCFGSTYLCEVAFSSMKYRSCLTDSHLDDALREVCSSYTPDFRQLAANMQCQIFH
ncbi:hypothetical protein B7P43_G17573 [Cryptotermes secundus]|uniref:HAT C-terminal dimerisation domain-containing protein n=1 Tax=Cryptotermes secundus TaxID=105785 RepID=A0A2J7PTI9_9NEOP|nr:hypothetical protein B7P43_G17573 [Cryptotermes secundus]